MSKWERVTRDELKQDEGLRLKPYQDTLGKWTQGYGRHVGIGPHSEAITVAQAEDWLDEDMDTAIDDARSVCRCFDALDTARKTVLANMAFNLGRTKLLGFKRFLAAVEDGDYQTAALEMINSRWAKQVKGRADRLAKRMNTGTL